MNSISLQNITVEHQLGAGSLLQLASGTNLELRLVTVRDCLILKSSSLTKSAPLIVQKFDSSANTQVLMYDCLFADNLVINKPEDIQFATTGSAAAYIQASFIYMNSTQFTNLVSYLTPVALYIDSTYLMIYYSEFKNGNIHGKKNQRKSAPTTATGLA